MEASYGAPVDAGADPEEWLLADLNAAQREAVTHPEGPLLVLAGAGSGKTRVLTHRIAWLLATGRARPLEILAITFTNKAAGEMRERVGQLVGGVSRAMWVMTFHSACARILRAEATRLGYKRAFTIYDEADSLRMIKRCMQEHEIDPKRYAPRAIKSHISSAKNQLTDSTEYAQAAGSSFEEAVSDVYTLYERRMVEASAMDFDDLLVRTVNLLELFEDMREKYRRIFRWVLVDEYQDTNRAQYRMLQLIAEEHRNLTVVGDDFQAVYSFRGADIRNILEFEKDFPDAHTVLLEQNYRSTQTILDAANGLIAHNESQKEKHLWTDGASGENIVVAELDDEHAEARYVASEINALVEGGTPRDRIAVFYRMNAQSRVLEDTLVRFEIPYQVIGGHEVLRPCRDQGRGRLPLAAHQPRRRRLLRPRRQLAAPRDRPADPGAAALAGEHARRRHLGRVHGAGEGARPRRGRGEGGATLRRHDGRACARARRRPTRSPRCSRRSCGSPAISRCSRRSGRSRPRAGSRTSRSWSASPGSSTPTASSRAIRRRRRWRSSSPRSGSSPSRTT